jgi:hypothetical protein
MSEIIWLSAPATWTRRESDLQVAFPVFSPAPATWEGDVRGPADAILGALGGWNATRHVEQGAQPPCASRRGREGERRRELLIRECGEGE